MQAAESRRGRTSSADTRTPSGEVPSIEVGIGESNGQFITMRGIPTYSYALNHRGAALPRESGRPTGGARVPDFWAVRPGPRDSPQADVPGPRGPKRLFCSKYLARACATGCCPGCLLASDWHIQSDCQTSAYKRCDPPSHSPHSLCVHQIDC